MRKATEFHVVLIVVFAYMHRAERPGSRHPDATRLREILGFTVPRGRVRERRIGAASNIDGPQTRRDTRVW